MVEEVLEVVVRRARTTVIALVSVLVMGLAVAAASAGGSRGEAGVPKPPVSSASGLKIADFEAGSNNTYVQTRMKAVKAAAGKAGAAVTIFDANWDPNQQVNQMQTALASKKYNAWLVQAVVPDPLCNVVKQAIAAGIIVIVANQPLCGATTYTPGTVGFVGGQTRDTYSLWLKWILDDNRAGADALLVTGPAQDANRRNLLAAYAQLKAKYPKFKFAADQPTDYSTAKALQVSQDVLLAKKNITVVVTNWSGSTQGVVQAIKSAHLGRKVKVYDLGANAWAVGAVKAGQLRMTFPLLPALEGQRSIEALVDYVTENKVAKFVNLVRDPTFKGKLPFITKQNANSYKAQF
jgi:ribose transport system substrate-binding protein